MSEIQVLVESRQRLLWTIEDISRIGSTRQAMQMIFQLEKEADRLLEGWKREHCTQRMAGGGFCGWLRAGYDGDTCGHND